MADNFEEFAGDWADTATDPIVTPSEEPDATPSKSKPRKEEQKEAPEQHSADAPAPAPRGGPAPATKKNHQRPASVFPTQPPFKAFVGRLPHNTEPEDIFNLFHDCNVVDLTLVSDNDGNFKGFGYVQFEGTDDLRRALSHNNENFRGRRIRVDIAQDRGPRNDGRRGRRGGRGRYEGRGRRGGRRGRGGFRNRGPVREESPVRAEEKVNPFGAARPREAVLADRKKKEQEIARQREAELAKKKEEHGSSRGRRGRGRGKRGRGRSYRGRGRDSGQGRDASGNRPHGRGRGKGKRGGGKHAGDGGRKGKHTKGQAKDETPYVPEFKGKPLKKPLSSAPTTTSNPFDILALV